MKTTAAVLAGIAAMSLAFQTAAEPTDQRETVTVWQVDYAGRPPFKRTQVELPVADVARMEVQPASGATVRVRTTDFSGRPPFRRSYAELPVVDTARLEADIEPGAGSIQPRPFFKQRHR